MSRTSHVRLLASYNSWMNAKLYEAAATLAPEVLAADKQAFFSSILGTLHHIMIGDTIWLKRFSGHPAAHAALDPLRSVPMPTSPDPLPSPGLPELMGRRRDLDALIEAGAASLSEADLDHVLVYTRAGVQVHKDFFSLAMHFFNHQTHHRGQATTLLSQEGIDVGTTDLLRLITDAGRAGLEY